MKVQNANIHFLTCELERCELENKLFVETCGESGLLSNELWTNVPLPPPPPPVRVLTEEEQKAEKKREKDEEKKEKAEWDAKFGHLKPAQIRRYFEAKEDEAFEQLREDMVSLYFEDGYGTRAFSLFFLFFFARNEGKANKRAKKLDGDKRYFRLLHCVAKKGRECVFCKG